MIPDPKLNFYAFPTGIWNWELVVELEVTSTTNFNFSVLMFYRLLPTNKFSLGR